MQQQNAPPVDGGRGAPAAPAMQGAYGRPAMFPGHQALPAGYATYATDPSACDET